MANGYDNGVATATTTAAKLVTVQAENDGVLVQNLGAVPIYLGGASVTADQTATGGFSVAASSSALIPSVGGYQHDLYVVVASTTAKVAWLQPTYA
jgi:hypothetical protein